MKKMAPCENFAPIARWVAIVMGEPQQHSVACLFFLQCRNYRLTFSPLPAKTCAQPHTARLAPRIYRIFGECPHAITRT